MARLCCQRAELAGLLHRPAPGGTALVETDLPAVARKALHLLKGRYGLRPEVRVRPGRLQSRLHYRVRAPLPADVAEELGVGAAAAQQGRLPAALVEADCCRAAFMRGLFLAAGSVTHPAREHHLEIVLRDEQFADAVIQILFAAGLRARLGARKDTILLYLKEAGQIADFLVWTGAHDAVLQYENTRAFREVKARINRLVNAETANVAKAVEAALRQVADIRLIEHRIGLAALSEPLRELAQLRLANPEASLAELGEQCRPPVGKSGVNHRLRKLAQIAAGLRETGSPGEPSPGR